MTDPFAPLLSSDKPERTEQLKAPVYTPIVPVPEEAPGYETFICRSIPEGYRLAARWSYSDLEGRLCFVIARFDAAIGKDKIVKPATFCEDQSGKRLWRFKAQPGNRVCYNLAEIYARPQADVVVVEGEKAADAAKRLFPDRVVTTSSGGSKAAKKSDWSWAKNRVTYIWPDNDSAGKAYARDVASLLLAAGAASILIVEDPAAAASRARGMNG